MTTYGTLFVAGDTAPDLTGTLTSGAEPVDITNATINLNLTKPDKTVIERAGVAVSAADGTWRYTWQAGELTPGLWSVEAEVTFAGGSVQTFPAGSQVFFKVRAQAA